MNRRYWHHNMSTSEHISRTAFVELVALFPTGFINLHNLRMTVSRLASSCVPYSGILISILAAVDQDTSDTHMVAVVDEDFEMDDDTKSNGMFYA